MRWCDVPLIVFAFNGNKMEFDLPVAEPEEKDQQNACVQWVLPKTLQKIAESEGRTPSGTDLTGAWTQGGCRVTAQYPKFTRCECDHWQFSGLVGAVTVEKVEPPP